MEKAYIISTGTELLLGNTYDSNSIFLAQQLNSLGIQVVGKSTVGDDKEQIERIFNTGISSADIIISTGGLGPTFDDLTKAVVCELMNCRLELRNEEVQRLRSFYEHRKKKMPEINLSQAMFPGEAIVLQNNLGTAPGMYLRKDNKLIILLPGPPREMSSMFSNEVLPLIIDDFGTALNKNIHKTIKVIGPGESQVEEMLGNLIGKTPEVSFALLAVDGEIHIKLSSLEKTDSNVSEKIDQLTDEIAQVMGKNIFAYDEITLVEKVAAQLLNNQYSVAVAESCTGGLVAKMLTDLPGSSQYFWGGVCSYSNQSKMNVLDVKAETLNMYGAVSPETAKEMACSIRERSGTDFGISITGIAGPDGGCDDKPVGLVYIGLADKDGCKIRELRLGGGREIIRILSAKSALDLLRRRIEYP